jgi:hypothetical protein
MIRIFCRRGAARIAAVAALFLASAVPATAQFSIQSPKVEKGEFEIETHSSVQSGLPKADEDDEEGGDAIRHGHEIEAGYGFTDFWKAELGITVQKPVDDGLEASSIELTNIFQLGTVPRWNATFGMLAAVSVGLQGDEPNSFEFGPLVEFGDEHRSLTLNGIFEKTFGDNREEGIGFEYAAQVKFATAEHVALGVEAFGEIEEIGNAPSFDETELRIGPAVFFSFGEEEKLGGMGDDDNAKEARLADMDPEVKAGLGLLFGATDATPDLTVKWDLEVSF